MQEQTLQLEQQSKLKVSSGGGAGRGRLHPCGGGTWKEKVTWAVGRGRVSQTSPFLELPSCLWLKGKQEEVKDKLGLWPEFLQ